MSGSSPSYEELAALAAAQAVQVERLTARVAELERRLGLNSRNSSKPPSSDGLGKPPPRSLRKKQGRRPGKQPGSSGVTLRQVADPDEVVEHRPARCRGCRADLAGAGVAGIGVRQVFDVVPARVRVVEHRLWACRCRGCGTVSTPPAPPGVAAPVQYGPGLAALVVYLAVGHHLPVGRVVQICADLLGVKVSTGWVAGRLAPAARALTGFDSRVRAAVRAAAVAHFDESGARVGGRTRWLHTAATATATVYDLHDKRGRVAMDAAGILPGYPGIAVHDAWQPYFTYHDVDHALCNAHLLRELIGWHEADPARHAWAATAIDLLTEAHTAAGAARAAGRHSLPAVLLADYRRRWAAVITAGHAANPRPPGRDPVGALINRMRAAATEIWRFAHDLRVPFDNNQAERDIRMIKLQTKTSGGWRTTHGAHDWLRIRSYISTTNKNGLHMLTAIRDALTGNPWLPPLTTTT